MKPRHAMRRLADTLEAEKPLKRSTFVRGHIDHIDTGAAADGHDAVFVKLGADIIPAPYYDSYTPTVGDLVDVRLDNGSPLITGHIIGLPDF